MARPARKARGSRGTAPATPSRGGSCTCAGSRWTCDRRKSSCGSSTSSRPRWTRCARAQISPPFAPANPPRSQRKRRPTQANSHQDRGNRRAYTFGGAFFFLFAKRDPSRAPTSPRTFCFLTHSRLFPRNPAGRFEHPRKMRRHRRRRPPAHDAASERRGGGPRRRRRRRRETLRLGSARRRRRIHGRDGGCGRGCGCFGCGCFCCGYFDCGCFSR